MTKDSTDINIEIGHTLGWSDIHTQETWLEYKVKRLIGLPPNGKRTEGFDDEVLPDYYNDLNEAWELLIKYMPDEISSIMDEAKNKSAKELAADICDNLLIYISAGLVK